MLHINNKNQNTHKKVFAVEVFISVMLFLVFHIAAIQASDITADNVIKLVNKARENANVTVLAKNDLLQKAAQKKAQDMIENNYFAHTSPDGKTPWFWIDNAGYDYKFAGENLAINYTNAEDEQKAWMDSPLHRKNILNPDYQEIGVAVKQGVIDGHETTIAVQEFGTKMSVAVVAEITPAKPAPTAAVAGAAAQAPKQDNVNTLQTNLNKIDLKALAEKNMPTLDVWFAIFGLALIVMLIDVAAVFHKKHGQLLILHDARNRHA